MPNFLTALLLAIAVVATAAVSGCGQTGPLYMPDEAPPKKHASSRGAGNEPVLTPDGGSGASSDPLVNPDAGPSDNADDPLITP